MKECHICKEIEEKGKYEHVCYPGEYLRVTIEQDSRGDYIYMTRSSNLSYIWEMCNYCPQCGRELNKKEVDE